MQFDILIQIFMINLVYIMLNTLRTLMTMRGYQKIAPIISIVEIMIYTLGLSMVMQYISQPIYLITYALGFAVGIYLGIMLENQIALGYSIVQIFSLSTDHTLAEALRARGYGVTIQQGYGRDGDRLILTVLTPRATEVQLRKTIDEIDPKAFYISYDAKYIHGGFWTKRINKLRINKAIDKDEVADEIVIEEVPTKQEYIDSDLESPAPSVKSKKVDKKD